jgi:acyl-CoA thioester hydrolase
MNAYQLQPEIRWSDLDPNFHLRHSVYYDYGAYCRVNFLREHGLTPEIMLQHHIGPILFREECLFKKEIRMGDQLTINVMLDKATADFSRWTMIHELWKNKDVLAALITVDGAWIDTRIRKLAKLPVIFTPVFQEMDKTVKYQQSGKHQ